MMKKFGSPVPAKSWEDAFREICLEKRLYPCNTYILESCTSPAVALEGVCLPTLSSKTIEVEYVELVSNSGACQKPPFFL